MPGPPLPRRRPRPRLLRGSRQEDEHHLPLGLLEMGLRLAVAGPAAALDTAARVVEGYELAGGSPRYAWPLVAEAALVCVVAARDERLRSGVASLAGRLGTIAEKLETFGPAQEASRATFFAADAQLAGLLSGDVSGAVDGVLGGVCAWDEAAGGLGRGQRAVSAGAGAAARGRGRAGGRGPGRARRTGCERQPRWPPGWARARWPARSRCWPGGAGSCWTLLLLLVCWFCWSCWGGRLRADLP